MLTEVKNQVKVTLLSLKYSFMRELLNKATFISNIVFMMLNNACMIVQWIVLFTLRSEFGGYTFKHVVLLWGLASGTYGVAHAFFYKTFHLSDAINSGKLDAYIVQPKNILISIATSEISVSAIGDILYAIVCCLIYGLSIKTLILFSLFCITGGIMVASIAIIFHSLSFWIGNADLVAQSETDALIFFATYPDGIFKGVVRALLFTLIPVGLVNYLPIKMLINYDYKLLLMNLGFCILFMILSFIVFYRGLRRYSSSNLMSARI